MRIAVAGGTGVVGRFVVEDARERGHDVVVREVPLPGGFGRALRDGTLMPGPSAQLGRQTFAERLRF